MKVLLNRALLAGMLATLADMNQQEFYADVEDMGDGKARLRYVIEGGKLIPFSESRVEQETETPVEAPATAPAETPAEPEATDSNPDVDLTDATALMALKLGDLQGIAEKLGLPTDGKKPELINAIMAKASESPQP